MATKRAGRPKPVAAKAGVSKNPKRRYACGGKLMKRGGRCCK